MKRVWLIPVLLIMAVLGTIASRAQEQDPLRPPKGARLALVVFEDLQCPDCARAAPLVEEASRTYKIPVVRHDFPLPQHAWSKQAAIFARWFDTKSPAVGNEYRDEVFAHQREITPESLRRFTEQFAAAHKMKLPFAVDPRGKLASLIDQDKVAGQRIGITHTPTLYVVSDKKSGTPFVEVVDRSRLFEMIDAMKAEVE